MSNPYPKLVRDKIPAIIEANGEHVTYHRADYEEYLDFFYRKVNEELAELAAATTGADQLEELADLQEVVDAIRALRGFSTEEVALAQASKRDARGGFTDHIIIDSIP